MNKKTIRSASGVLRIPSEIANSFDGLSVVDKDRVIVFLSPSCERIYDWPISRLLGQNLDTVMAQRVCSPCVSWEAVSSGRVVTRLQQTHTGKQVLATAQPVLDKSGRVIGAVVNHREYGLFVGEEPQESASFPEDVGEMVARSAAMKEVLRLARKSAAVDATVVVTGESGTGKTALCRYIHNHSPRKDGPYVAINCAAIPGSLIESELFGYREGAFTGALKGGKKGILESANGGTVVLDEIGELPLEVQAKLLQVLDERAAFPVGGRDPVRFDVRFLATTNMDFVRAIGGGKFRQDLYYRLCAFQIHIPPLRERREDIPQLVAQIMDVIRKRYGLSKSLAEGAMSTVMSHDWPGNVRQLQHVLLSAAISTDHPFIETADLMAFVSRPGEPRVVTPANWALAIRSTEADLLLAAARKDPSVASVAKDLGLSQPTVMRKARRAFGSWRNLKRMVETLDQR